MAIKTFTTGEVLTAADTNTYLANSGLVYIKSQTVTGASPSVTVTSAFSTTYDNYKIIYIGGTGTGNAVLSLAFTGTNGNTSWYGNLQYSNFAGGAVVSAGMSNATSITYVGGNINGSYMASFELQGPFLSTPTFVNAPYCDGNNAGSLTGLHANSASYTGFTLTTNISNLTGGTITVYGYRKA